MCNVHCALAKHNYSTFLSLESDDYNESAEEAVTTEQDGEKKKKPKKSLSFTRLLSADARLESAVSHDYTTLTKDKAVMECNPHQFYCLAISSCAD